MFPQRKKKKKTISLNPDDDDDCLTVLAWYPAKAANMTVLSPSTLALSVCLTDVRKKSASKPFGTALKSQSRAG